MKKILLSALAIAALAGCSKNEDGPSGDRPAEIRLNTGIATRAAYGNADAIAGLQFLRVDATNETGLSDAFASVRPSIEGSRATDGAITFDNKQYYNEDGTTNSYFYSYYPAGTFNDGMVTWTIDGTTDILKAENYVDAGNNSTPKQASINYLHQLSQIEVICKAENAEAIDRWGKITSIKVLDTPSEMTLDYEGFAVATANDTGDEGIAMLDGNGYANPLAPFALTEGNSTVNACGMYAPSDNQNVRLAIETEKGGDAVINVVLDGEGSKLERGKKHKITLTFGDEATTEEITFDSTVEEWTEGATGEGTIN